MDHPVAGAGERRGVGDRDHRAAAACISERMVSQICIYGSPQMCRSQLAMFRAAGARLPLLTVSPVNASDRLGATRTALRQLAP